MSEINIYFDSSIFSFLAYIGIRIGKGEKLTNLFLVIMNRDKMLRRRFACFFMP